MRTMGPPFLEYTPVGVHTRCSTLDLDKKLGGILISMTRLNARFWSRSPLFHLLFFFQKFSSLKLFVSVSSHMFFLRIILVEGFCILFVFDWRFEICKCVHGCLRALEKYASHVCPIKTLAHVCEQAFCNVLVGFLQTSA